MSRPTARRRIFPSSTSFLDGNRLPPGKYLMVVTLRGDSNWNRQVLFFEVAED